MMPEEGSTEASKGKALGIVGAIPGVRRAMR